MDHFKHRLCNAALAPAQGDEDSVDTLNVQQGTLGGAVVTRSFWKPSAEELAMLLSGGCVMLSVLSRTHAPLRLDTIPDEPKLDKALLAGVVGTAVMAAEEAGYRVEVRQESQTPLAMGNVKPVVELTAKYLRQLETS